MNEKIKQKINYLLFTSGTLLFPITVLAEKKDEAKEVSSGVNPGLTFTPKFATIYELLEFVVNLLLSVSAIVAVIFLVIGGIRYVLSAGNKDAVAAAKNTILYSIIGLIIIIIAWAIVRMVSTLFGVTPTQITP